jgi:molecular chaperone GrpE
MSDRRQVWETLASLILRLEQDINRLGISGGNGRSAQAETAAAPALEALEKEVRKLGKAQFKANTLTESQHAHANELIASLKQSQAQEAEAREALVQQQVAAARQEMLAAFLPALDSVDQALASGQRYLAVRDKAAGQPGLTPAQARLVSPADRAMLAGWLDGLRLTRERLLAILAAGGVKQIATVGHPFDPYLHRAVGITDVGPGPAGTIVAEERTGYQSPTGVLRYAEVVVYRPRTDAVSPRVQGSGGAGEQG